MEMCDYWWGTHACDLPARHKGFHRCGLGDDLCCEYDGVRVRFGGVGKWLETGGGRVSDILARSSFTENLTVHD